MRFLRLAGGIPTGIPCDYDRIRVGRQPVSNWFPIGFWLDATWDANGILVLFQMGSNDSQTDSNGMPTGLN